MFQGFDKCQTSAQIDRNSKGLQTSTTTEQDNEGWTSTKNKVRERKCGNKKDDRKEKNEGWDEREREPGERGRKRRENKMCGQKKTDIS